MMKNIVRKWIFLVLLIAWEASSAQEVKSKLEVIANKPAFYFDAMNTSSHLVSTNQSGLTIDGAEFEFDDNGYMVWGNVQSEFDKVNGFLDPGAASTATSTSGFTIRCKVETRPANLSETESHYIFWVTDVNNKLLFGLKRKLNQLFIDRYVSWTGNYESWEFELWRRNNFQVTGGWHELFISVRRDMIRIKVYQPGEVVNSTDALQGFDGNTELSYFGGQLMNTANNFGFGSVNGSKAVKAIRDFKIYDQPITFQRMDELYNGATAASRVAASKEEEVMEGAEFFIYPNPTASKLHLVLHAGSAGTNRIRFTDLKGVTIFQQDMQLKEGRNEIDLNVEGVASGLYLIQTKGSAGTFNRKILIK